MKNNILKQKTDNFSSKKLDWSFIQQEMKNKFGQEIYESWIKKIEFVNEFNDYILISVSTRFIRDWITSRYLDQILAIVREHKKDIIRIEFLIEDINKVISNKKEQNEDEKKVFLNKYLQQNDIKNNANIKHIVEYFNKYEAFCFDLSSDSVLQGELKFNYV